MLMEIEFDTNKDAANQHKHGVSLSFGAKIFDDPNMLVVPTVRPEDGEERYKAIGMIDGKLWSAVHVYRGDAVRFLSVRRSNANEQGIYNSD